MEEIEANVEDCDERNKGGIKFSEMDKMLKDCNRYMNECEEVLQDCAKYFENVSETESIFSDEDDSISETGKESNFHKALDEDKKASFIPKDPDGYSVKNEQRSENTSQNVDLDNNENDIAVTQDSEESVNKIEEERTDTSSNNVNDFVASKDLEELSEIPVSVSEGDESHNTTARSQIGKDSYTESTATDNDDMKGEIVEFKSENNSTDGSPSLARKDSIENRSELNSIVVNNSTNEDAENKENCIDKVDNTEINATIGPDLATEHKSLELTDNVKDSNQHVNNTCCPDIPKVQTDSDTSKNDTKIDPANLSKDKSCHENNDNSVDDFQHVSNDNKLSDIQNKPENIKVSIDSSKLEPETKDLTDDDHVFIYENAKMDQIGENTTVEAVKVRLDHLESDDSQEDDSQNTKLVPLRISEEFDTEIEKMKSNVEEYVNKKLIENSIGALYIDHEMSNNDESKMESNNEENSKSIENRVESNSEIPEVVDIVSEIVVKYKMEGTQTVNEELKLKTEDEAERDKHVSLQGKMEELERELSSTKAALKLAHNQLANQQSAMNSTVMTLKLELYKTQTALKRERAKSHQQLTDVISHLMFLEGNLRNGQLKHKKEMKAKDATVEIQRMEIMKLRDQNEQLLNAIKEICANGGMNGYMRDKHSHSEKKGNNGKLGMVKDKLLMKNRSSLELNNFNVEKFNLKNQRLCSSQEDLKNLHDDAFEDSSPSHDKGSVFRNSRNTSTRGSKNGNKGHRKNLQNFFTEPELPKHEMNKSNSDSSQLSESSGVYSMSDHDCPRHTSGMNGHGNHFDDDDFDDDDDDGRIFSFSSTHINTVIDEEEALGPVVSHSGHMMSMGSMPMLAPVKERPNSNKDRPHSLSSVDLLSIQRQAANLSKSMPNETISEMSTTPTPPPSPSYNNNNNNNSKSDSGKSEMTPFQTFKTMFKRKGSKNKGNKKRSVSLSQTTNMEYTEALKKHFQKFDMQ